MTQKEDFGGSHLTEDQDGILLIIPRAGFNLGVGCALAIYALWLTGWAVGEIMVARFLWMQLVSRTMDLGGHTVFMLAWFGVWTLGGLALITTLVISIVRSERMQFTEDGIVHEIDILLRRSTGYFPSSDVTHLRAVERGVKPERKSPMQQLSADGTIQFDYKKKSWALGVGIDPAEARYIVDRVVQRFPQFGGPQKGQLS